MQAPDLSKWKYDKKLEGLLFFAQCIDEMLFHHTIDTFKAYALNLHTTILELRILAMHIQNNRIQLGSIKPIIEELDEKIKLDPIISIYKTTLFSQYYKELSEEKNPQKIKSICEACHNELLTFYWTKIKEEIASEITEYKSKQRIYSLAMSFIAEAELQGYSREYIYIENKHFFFENSRQPREISSINQINDFLSHFSDKNYKWKIVYKGEERFEKIPDLLKLFNIKITKNEISEEIESSFDIPDYFLKNDTDNEYPFYIIVSIDEAEIKEANSARKIAQRQLDVVSDVYTYISHEKSLSIDSDVLACNMDTREIYNLSPKINPMKLGVDKRDDENHKEELSNFIDMTFHFQRKSRSRFFSSIDFHQAAIEVLKPENQLIDLWVALEGFLPPPSTDANRISQYIDSIVPALVLSYPEKIFRYLDNSLFFSNDSVKELINSIEPGKDFFEKTIILCTTKEKNSERNELYELLNPHPLLINRVYRINENFKSNQSIRRTLKAHKNRVSWHIQRIYSLRNQIVHNANSLPYLDTLVSNLHNYLDVLFESFSKVTSNKFYEVSIESLLTEFKIHEHNLITSLEGEKRDCTTINWKDLVFGDCNPLNPIN